MKKRLLFLSAWVLLLISLKFFGVFQPLELALYDHYWQVVPREEPDPNVVIVAIDEDDLRTFGQWPPSNDQLADLIISVEAQNPAVIGLDIFRDLGVSGKLEQVFRHSQKLIGIGQHNNGVNFPAILRQRKRVGDVTVVREPDYGHLRRLFLYSLTDGSEDSEIGNPSLMLVFDYLKAKNQGRIGTNQKTGELTINERTVPDLHRLDGGYSLRKMSGSQMLIRWRKGNYDPNQWEQSFKVVTVKNIKEGQIDPKLFTGKIVLIGYRALSVKDRFITPVGLRYGVDVVAHATSQVRSFMEDDRPFFWFLPEWVEYGLLIGGVGLAYSHWRFSRFESVWRESWIHGAIALLVLVGLYYSGLFWFSKGLWIPMGSVILAYGVSLWLLGLGGYINHIHWQNLRQARIISEKTADLEESNRQLRESQERRILEEKQLMLGRFATELTHTMKTVIGILDYEINIFLKKRITNQHESLAWLAKPENFQNFQESINNQRDSLENLSEVLKNLQAVYHGEMSEAETFDVNEALSEIIYQYQRPLSHHGIRLQTDIAQLGVIRYYRLIFQEMITHLIINAQEAIQAVPGRDREGEISMTAKRFDNRLVFTIKDNGSGMSPEIQARIFEPLFTTKENGMGWGLYFVYQNLHSCQGDITISSLESVGTTIKISFPVP